MSLIDNALEWPYKNKGKAALMIGSLGGPLTHAYHYLSHTLQGQDYHADPDKLLQQYLLNGMLGIATAHIWLTIFGRIKPPRLRNFFTAVGRSFKGVATGFSSDAEARKESLAATVEVLADDNPRLADTVDASYLVSKGEYGAGLEKHAAYLETHRERETNLTDLFVTPAVAVTMRLQSAVRRDLSSRLAECFFHLEYGSQGYMTHSLWPEILRRYGGDLEIHILRALMVSQTKLEDEAWTSWQRVLDMNRARLRPIADSRNEVVEIDANKYIRNVVAIKRGEGLEREYRILQHLRKHTPVEPQTVVMPVAFYRTGNQEILITKRRPSDNLEKILRGDRSRVQAETESALRALATIHACPKPNTPLEQYNPMQEIGRRLFARLGYTTKAGRLEAALRAEWEQREIDGTTLIHGDFYPTNVLEGGLILDFEKAGYGDAAYDVENFIGAPEMEDLDEDATIRAYGDERDLKNRDLWRVHSALCQVGSFHAKGDDINRGYFAARAMVTMEQASMHRVRAHFEAYLEQAKVAL